VAVTVASSQSETWRFIAPAGAAFGLAGIGLGVVTRRLSRRLTRRPIR
jgi:hypothetical protein